MTIAAPRLFSKVDGDAPLPDEVDFVLIGGGSIGASTALELAERGYRVAICEKGEIGGEQSSRNWGWVRRMGRDVAEIPLAMESRRLWRDLAARVGADVGYVESGILYVAANEREMRGHESWMTRARPFGLDSKLLSAREVAELIPNAGRNFVGGLFTASDGRAEPSLTTAAIARAARQRGAVILSHCAARGIETKAGALSGVVTERGVIKCAGAVLAGGAWTRLFAGNLGINFPQLVVRGAVARVESSDALPEITVGGTDFAFRKRQDGGYSIAVRNGNFVPLGIDNFRLFFDYMPALRAGWRDLKLRFGKPFFQDLKVPRRWRMDEVSPFETLRINDSAPFGGLDVQALKNVAQAFPDFAKARITLSWSGLIDVTPTGLPVIDRCTIPGLFIASGFSGHGFGVGPGVGRVVAELLTGQPAYVDVAPFQFKKTGI